MEYLFFDIECSDGHSICSFGYCLVDEKFKIIEKKDIVINPENKFKLSRHGETAEIKLAYDETYFYSQENFAYHYGEIRNLLTRKDTTLVGHSVGSDLQFLFTACKRYKKEVFKIIAYDAQLIYSKKPKKLETIIEELNVKTKKLKYHKSSDDAELTMLYVKAICKSKKCSLKELLDKNKNCIKTKVSFYKQKSKKRSFVKMPMARFSIQDKFVEELKRKGIDFEKFMNNFDN